MRLRRAAGGTPADGATPGIEATGSSRPRRARRAASSGSCAAAASASSSHQASVTRELEPRGRRLPRAAGRARSPRCSPPSTASRAPPRTMIDDRHRARPRDRAARLQPLRRGARAHAGMLPGSTCWWSISRTWARATTPSSWTMALAMRACARAGVPVIVLDRPNPLGGEQPRGQRRRSRASPRSSACYPLPIRHGMTIGELAALPERDARLRLPT